MQHLICFYPEALDNLSYTYHMWKLKVHNFKIDCIQQYVCLLRYLTAQ